MDRFNRVDLLDDDDGDVYLILKPTLEHAASTCLTAIDRTTEGRGESALIWPS